MFATAVDSLAMKGRCIGECDVSPTRHWFNTLTFAVLMCDHSRTHAACAVIGMMSAYGTGWPATISKGLPEKLLPKSASVRGFFLLQYTKEIRAHFAQLCALLHSGQLRVSVDPRSFVGADAVVDAVEHLQSGKSVGEDTSSTR